LGTFSFKKKCQQKEDEMEIRKQQEGAEPSVVSPEDLEAINRLAKTPLAAEQVYTFAVRLCDNEVDRDFERFDEEALSALGDLFVGRTGIFDHRWSAEGQTARIYRTELVHEPGRTTMAGDGYCYLKGWAYLLRTERNAELIAEIEGGIKKEVSVGCSVRRSVCSVCGADSGTCEHVKGQLYGGKLCYAELREPSDAYEWSFVAVPAQREAGVLKKTFGDSGAGQEELRRLRQEAELGRKYLSGLRTEVARLALLADGDGGRVMAGLVSRLSEPELVELKKSYEDRVAAKFPVRPQLRRREVGGEKETDTSGFLV